MNKNSLRIEDKSIKNDIHPNISKGFSGISISAPDIGEFSTKDIPNCCSKTISKITKTMSVKKNEILLGTSTTEE